MKTVNAIKFRLSSLLKITLYFFLLIFAISLAALIAGIKDRTAISNINAIYTYSGYLLTVLAFFFGLCSYKTNFKFLLQNGVSRQHIHFSFIVSLIINAVTVLCNTLLYTVFFLLARALTGSDMLFEDGMAEKLIMIPVCIAIMSFGYLLAAFAYSTKTITKIITAGVIVFCLLMFVLFWIVGSEGDPMVILFAVYSFLFGSVTGFVYTSHLLAALCCVTVFCLSLSHIIINRAAIKR